MRQAWFNQGSQRQPELSASIPILGFTDRIRICLETTGSGKTSEWGPVARDLLDVDSAGPPPPDGLCAES